ncbi:MAG: glycosyltransferase 87 family protein [Smithella sp.]
MVLLATYALFSILMVALSMRLWFQVPLTLTQFEFDYFLGFFRPANLNLVERQLLLGRLLHFAFFCIVGYLFLVIAHKLLRKQASMTVAEIAGYAALLSTVYALGMPWVSPDVFCYIGTGWLEGHYGLNPYLHSVSDVAGFTQDEMFQNIFPGFLGRSTAYGPLFQIVAKGVALLSGGNEKLALALYKILNLGVHVGASYLVYRIAPKTISHFALFAYAANPLILFSVLTCAHNDHLMNFFLMLALFLLREKRLFWGGCALGAATCIKYFPLLFLPILAGAVVLTETERSSIAKRFANAGLVMLGFVSVGIGMYFIYPEYLSPFIKTFSRGGGDVLRNSIYVVWLLVSQFVTHSSFNVFAGTLRFIFIFSYALIFTLYLCRLRRDWFYGAIEVCLIVAVLYFIIVNTANQEWYLTWLLGLAFVLNRDCFHNFGLKLSALFMPLVIFTVKNPPLIMLFSNLMLYLIVLIYGAKLLWHTLSARSLWQKQS